MYNAIIFKLIIYFDVQLLKLMYAGYFQIVAFSC